MAPRSGFFEPAADRLAATEVLAGCVESGARGVLLDESALSPDVVDLATGVLGELLHKLSTYRIRLAGVVPDPSRQPLRFQEFLREANAGNQFRFFPSRAEAVAWLERRDGDSVSPASR